MVRIERLIIVLLGIALLQAWWELYRGKVKRWWKRTKDWIPRHWQPKSPADCPRCQGGEEIEEVVLPVETLPYAERKSRRGRKKQLDTHGWACPNERCELFGETDAKRHALVGHRKIGRDKNIQRLKCQVCETTVLADLHIRSGFSPETRGGTMAPLFQLCERKARHAAVLAGFRQAWIEGS